VNIALISVSCNRQGANVWGLSRNSSFISVDLYTLNTSLMFNYENNQQDELYRLIYYSKSAQNVSGDVFAHHQEHLYVFTASGTVYPSCCRLAADSNLGEH
jgi:hypothetical protein